jgi:TonB family protein
VFHEAYYSFKNIALPYLLLAILAKCKSKDNGDVTVKLEQAIRNQVTAMRFALCLFMAVTVAGCAQPQPGAASASFTVGHPATGTAVALLDVDYASGTVTAVRMLKSTGYAKFDAETIRRLRQWRFQPREFTHVKVPITFTVKGIGQLP